jgi:hypothetical protein
MNVLDIVAASAGYGLLAIAGLFIGIVSLIGVLLGGMTALGHLVRRRDDDHMPEDTGADGEPVGLASFRWSPGPD